MSVVFDDVHSIIYDPRRGPILYEINAFFKNKIIPKPRIVVLSAQFENPKRLNTLFGLKKVVEDPKKYEAPKISIINYDSTAEKRRKISEFLQNLADDGTRTLVFMNKINEIELLLKKAGNTLGEAISYDIDSIVKKRLDRVGEIMDELGYSNSAYIRQGIGYNHGLMDETQRGFIEWVFRRRYLRFLFGTQALAYGVNTPVKHVVMGSPGIDEIFRQSMMVRAVWMRRGRGQPGDCTVFTKTISESEQLEKTFYLPKMPVTTVRGSYMSNYLLGLIGLDIFRHESEADKWKQELKLFYKWISTDRGLKKPLQVNPALVEKQEDGALELAPLGLIAFQNVVSGDQVNRIIEGIQLLLESGKPPTIFDLLLIMNYATIISGGKRAKKRLKDDLRSFLEDEVESSVVNLIVNTEKEQLWHKAIEYSVLGYTSIKEELSFDTKTRKSTGRLSQELQMFSLNFRRFLEGLHEEKTLGNDKKIRKLLKSLVKLLDSEEFVTFTIRRISGKEPSLKGIDLSFVDFSEIEQSIDRALDSNLSALQKIQLIELLESVESTTSAFVELMKKAKDDPEALEILNTVCLFSKEGQIGQNLIKALVEEGVLEGSLVDQLLKLFAEGMEKINKKFGAPAAATNVLLSLFSGNIVEAAKSGVELLLPFIGKSKVDISGIT